MGIKEKINKFPESTGVYIMKDDSGKIIYIGKAKSLRKRAMSYFRSSMERSFKERSLVSNVKDIEYILTPSETQALLLEARLIKENIPKYNISLRDDKSFPWVEVAKEDFPAVFVSRSYGKKNAYFFGPYTSARLLRQALKLIRKIFPFRTCNVMPKSACLDYSLKLCPAPCIKAVSKEKYSKIIDNISLILEAKQDDLLQKLTKAMHEKSRKQDYEEAAKIRDQIQALSSIYRDKPVSFAGYRKEAEELKDMLRLRNTPERIEAFDVSNIFGKEAVGSMVSFYKGKPDKNNYRRFRIRQLEVIDDYKMLAEITQRRYKRLKEENLKMPDLIIIDGGKGQLSVAKKELHKLNLDIPIISIAKEKEIIFSVVLEGPIVLPFESASLQLVRRVRDEAHRFALAYHHILRRKKTFGEKKAK